MIADKNGIDGLVDVVRRQPDQLARVHEDVEMVRSHPLIAGRAEIGGFMYDVDTGRLQQII